MLTTIGFLFACVGCIVSCMATSAANARHYHAWKLCNPTQQDVDYFMDALRNHRKAEEITSPVQERTNAHFKQVREENEVHERTAWAVFISLLFVTLGAYTAMAIWIVGSAGALGWMAFLVAAAFITFIKKFTQHNHRWWNLHYVVLCLSAFLPSLQFS